MKSKGAQKPFDGHVGCTTIKGDEICLKNRTNSERAKTKETRCSMNIKIGVSQKNGRLYLGKGSDLEYHYHHEIPPEATKLDESDLDSEHMRWIGQMYRMGMPNGSITSVMTGVFEESGKNGEFVTC